MEEPAQTINQIDINNKSQREKNMTCTQLENLIKKTNNFAPPEPLIKFDYFEFETVEIVDPHLEEDEDSSLVSYAEEFHPYWSLEDHFRWLDECYPDEEAEEPFPGERFYSLVSDRFENF